MTTEELIQSVIDNNTSSADVIDEIISRAQRTAIRPRKRRFGKKSDAFDPITGKRKDPKRRLIARRAARKGRAKRKVSAKRFARSAKGKRFHRKLAKLTARIRRR